MAMMRLAIEGLTFWGYHGVYPEENETGGAYMVDASWDCETLAQESDQLEHTADYAKIVSQLNEIGVGAPCKTVEKLAWQMANAVKSASANIFNVELKVSKLTPPIQEELAAFSVTVRLD